MSGLWLVSYIALWILFLVLAIVLLSVLRNLGAVYELLRTQRQPLEESSTFTAGETVPALELPMVSGERRSTAAFQGATTAFLVVSPGCDPCHALLKELALHPSEPYPRDPSIRQHVIVSVADITATGVLLEQIGLNSRFPVLVDSEHQVRDRWGIDRTPTTLIVDAQARFIRQSAGFEGRPTLHAPPV